MIHQIIVFLCYEKEHKYIFYLKCYDNCPEGTISDLSEDNLKICKCQNLYYIDENNDGICLSSLLCDDNNPVLDEFKNQCLNYSVQYGNKYYYECPKNTCISKILPKIKILKIKLLI